MLKSSSDLVWNSIMKRQEYHSFFTKIFMKVAKIHWTESILVCKEGIKEIQRVWDTKDTKIMILRILK